MKAQDIQDIMTFLETSPVAKDWQYWPWYNKAILELQRLRDLMATNEK